MAPSHPITIFAPQKYYFFPQPPTNPLKYSKIKKEKAPKFIVKISEFQHLNWKRDPVGTFKRYLKSRNDTLKDYDSVIYEKLPSRNNRLKPLLYHKRGVHCIPPKNPPLFIKQERSDLKEIIARLNERLDEPFVTAGTVTGDKGIKQAQDEYQRLMNNKSPKSKRK